MNVWLGVYCFELDCGCIRVLMLLYAAVICSLLFVGMVVLELNVLMEARNVCSLMLFTVLGELRKGDISVTVKCWKTTDISVWLWPYCFEWDCGYIRVFMLLWLFVMYCCCLLGWWVLNRKEFFSLMLFIACLTVSGVLGVTIFDLWWSNVGKPLNIFTSMNVWLGVYRFELECGWCIRLWCSYVVLIVGLVGLELTVYMESRNVCSLMLYISDCFISFSRSIFDLWYSNAGLDMFTSMNVWLGAYGIELDCGWIMYYNVDADILLLIVWLVGWGLNVLID